ncbi:hypothetical protein QYF36_002659 [Acer negundo]|nr:hypothetical protein QYF36_002659 [Acer negundo]
MVKQRGLKPVKKEPTSPEPDFNAEEVERRIAAVRAIRDMEIENSLTEQRKDIDGNLSMDNADGRDIHASLLRQMSVAYPYYSGVPSFGGYELSTKSVKTSLQGVDNMQIRDFVLEEPSDSQMLGVHDALQTPGATSQRLSFGMTPKSRRLPKPGEMLLSVHGSPLGVFKEDNMEAIHESEES